MEPIALPASWDDYLVALPVGQADEVRGALRAFDDWTGGHADLRVARTARELAIGLEVLRALRGGARELDEELMPELFQRGVLELMWLSARREPVAALHNLVCDQRVVVQQEVHRGGLPTGVRADLVIEALAIRRAIECGRRTIEFPAGRLPQRSRFQ